MDGDDRVIAAAQQIVRSLGTSKNMKEDILLILSNFDNRLSNITNLVGNGANSRLAATEVIHRWSDSFLPWEDSPDEISDYLSAVDDVISLTESNSEDADVRDRAENALQMAMEKLEEEFRRLMTQNTEPMDTARLFESSRSVHASFASRSSVSVDEFDSFVEDERDAYGVGKSFRISFSEDLPVQIVKAEAIPHLQSIAERMIRARYEKECCQAYGSVRRGFLDESIARLGIEKMSIEEVQKIAWTELDETMKRWAQALKIIFEFLLASERKLCDQIFGISPSVGEICFTETTKGSIMQLLNFAEAVTIGKKSPEKLFRVLDMYDALSSVMPEFQQLFPEEQGEFLHDEAELVLRRLGDAAEETLAMFENAVQTEASRKQESGIHPLTSYVMNYLKFLMDYEGTLNELLGKKGLYDTPELKNEEDQQYSGTVSPLGRHVLEIISFLESNIEEKSKLYEDSGLRYVFLMNNMQYMVKRVKDGELRTVLGDDWIKKRRGQIRQHSRSYLRASWIRIISFVRDDGLSGGGSSGNAFKTAIKERFKSFNVAFEEIYRTQSTWIVTDPQLREELRIQISDMLIPAYRSFSARFGGHLEGGRHSAKYKKYSTEDLERCLSDLFEGSSLSSSSGGSTSFARRRH